MMLEAISGMTLTCTSCVQIHVIRNYVPKEEISSILKSCHATTYGRHFEDTEQQHKFFNQIITNSIFLKMLISLLNVVTGTKE